MKKKALLGAHFSHLRKTQLLGTVKDAITSGATSGALYISNSRSYRKFELDDDLIKQAHELAKENNFDIKNLIVHAPLVGNLANIDVESGIYENTLESYYQDLLNLEKCGLTLFNFHPGSCADKEKGFKQVAKGINELHKRTKGHGTILLLETMMTKGNYIGVNFEELRSIIDKVKDKSRIGICLDTCHVWDGGYDIKDNLNKVLKEFDNIIGLDYLKALHINDSKNELGSGKDRHDNIGKGFIGYEALHRIVNHPKLRDLPKALETPNKNVDLDLWIEEMKSLLK